MFTQFLFSLFKLYFMRKISVIAIILFFYSCSKQSSHTSKIAISPAASQVVGLKDPSQQKIGYNLLSTKDKTEIWSQRMSDILNTKPLNLKQREFIIRLKGIISQELFTENSQKNLQYKSAFENHLKEEILSLFELKTAKSFFASLETISRDGDNI